MDAPLHCRKTPFIDSGTMVVDDLDIDKLLVKDSHIRDGSRGVLSVHSQDGKIN